jgi:hypothetical protein
MIGVRSIGFRADALTVQRQGTEYVLVEGPTVLLRFGKHGDEAQEALETIQRYKFDRLCRFGQGDPAPLTFFSRAH